MVVIEATAAIGWMVSPIVNLVFNKTQTLIGKKYFEKSDIEDDMKKMNTTLGRILSIMGTVEQQRIVNPNEVQLVQEIKDAVCDAEDVMDEFEYNFLEKYANRQKKVALAASTSVAIYRAIADSNSFKKKVKEIGERLDRAKESATILLDLMIAKNSGNIQLTEQENPPLTSSLVSEEKVIGLENERKLLTDLLFEELEGPPTIVSIIGQGGIGKTTLAQMVINDLKVRNHFNHTIWLTVSDNFDKLRLTKEILKDLRENFSTQNASFNKLQKIIERVLQAKKTLLMLDDVWYVKDDNKRHTYEMDWLEFLAPWKKAKAGSKILVTTRQDLVASSLTSFGSVRTLSLDGLNDDHSWSLLKLKAFDGENPNDFLDLEPFGRKIVKKLNGLALAIRVVAMELRGKSDKREWEKVLNDYSLNTTDIMKILRRSYENLPEHLQRCFAYCSLFPKNHHLNCDRLVHMWIAQGFVHSQEGKILEKEKIGQSYFNELVSRSFIKVIKKGNKKRYVMHDLMNDLACHVSKGECCIVKDGDSIENLGSIRHLTVTNRKAIDILKNMHGLHKLRTMIFLNTIWFSQHDLIDDVFIKLKGIRVLDIEFDSLPNIAECKHLRYLCFRYNKNLKLKPDSLSKLHHLIMLFIRKPDKYREGNSDLLNSPDIPRSIFNMSSLVFIDISKSFTLDVGKWLKVPSLWRGGTVLLDVHKGGKLDILGEFNHIKKVEIIGLENVANKEVAAKAKLGKKERVTKLRLVWNGSSSEVESTKHLEVLEALTPHPSIEWLEINGYPKDVCPSWLESNLLLGLKSIELKECNELKELPSLGQLPQLKTLLIESMKGVSTIGVEFYGNGTFPSLEGFVLKYMMNLEKWSFPQVQSFLKLKKLEIIDCPSFVGPGWHGFPALQELLICGSNAMTMEMKLEGFECLPPLITMEIDNCTGIRTLGSWHGLKTLQKLTIKRCPNLFSLPEMELFNSLGLLKVADCPKLRLLPQNLPVSLQQLEIWGTHNDLEKQIQSKNGSEWNKVAAISGCLIGTLQGSAWETIKIDGHKGLL